MIRPTFLTELRDGRPTLALFSASDPALTGVLASTPAYNLGSRGHPPSVTAVLAAADPLL